MTWGLHGSALDSEGTPAIFRARLASSADVPRPPGDSKMICRTGTRFDAWGVSINRGGYCAKAILRTVAGNHLPPLRVLMFSAFNCRAVAS